VIDVRASLSDKVNRSRLELEARRAVRPAISVVIALLAALAIFIYIISHVSETLLSATHEVSFAVADATGIVPDVDDLRMRGIPAGQITQVDMVNGQAVVTARLRDEYGRIYKDASAVLRPNTALQDMYLDVLDRGTPAAGVLGPDDVLSETRTDTSVDISQVLNIFNPDVRGRLRTLLDNLGNGLDDNGARLRTAFAELAPLLDVTDRISRQLAERRPMVQRVVHNTGVLMNELGTRQQQLTRLLGDGSATLATLQAGSADLDATVAALPPTLRAIDSSFSAVRGVTGDLDQAVTDLDPVAGKLGGTLSSVRQLDSDLGPAVEKLKAPVHDLVPLARELEPLSASLRDSVHALNPQTATLDRTIKRVAGCKTGLQGFFQWDASMSKYGDVRGPVPRGNVVFGAQSTGVLNDPFEYAPQACTPGKPIGGRVPRREDEH
jgi:phospholipid/cholesterol/gamma-HCH transport system substrate-binding protein